MAETRFDRMIRRRGGELRIEELPSGAQDALAPFIVGVEADVRACGVRDIDVGWIHDSEVYAAAGQGLRGPRVALAFGVALAMQEVFHETVHNDHAFSPSAPGAWRYAEVGLHLGRSTRQHEGTDIRVHADPDRRLAAEVYADVAVTFILFHELAHVARGHLELATKAGHPFLYDGTCGSPGGGDVFRWIEMDADWVGMTTLVAQLHDVLVGDSEGSERLTAAAAMVWVPALTLAFLDRSAGESEWEKRHPHAVHRFRLTLDAGFSALQNIHGYPEADALEVLRRAARWLGSSARYLRLPEERWVHPGPEAWRSGVYREAAQAYYEWAHRTFSAPVGLDLRPR